jgi:hypothetical protein
MPQDSQGQFLSTCRVEIEGVIDIVTAEAQALRDGVRLEKRNGCNNVEVESDSLEVVNACVPRSDGGHNSRMVFLDEFRVIITT